MTEVTTISSGQPPAMSISKDLNKPQEAEEEKAAATGWWIPTSPQLLDQAEKRVLSKLKLPYKTKSVNVGPVVGKEDCEIWTLFMNEDSENIPLVLLHGFGAALGFWALNFDSLAQNGPVYAIDHLGFGRSSRPKFSLDAEAIELEFVSAVEEWRKRMGLNKIILAGHSFGGYIATSYALAHPDRVAHLLLLDPWGFPPKPLHETAKWWQRVLAFTFKTFNPFSPLRIAGPKGPSLLNRVRGDLIQRFDELNADGKDVRFGEYIYHCNVQTSSGDIAFSNMVEGLGRSKRPMIDRIPSIDEKVPVTVIMGSVSPIRQITEQDWKEKRNGRGFVQIHMLEGIGHHVYSDSKEKFHEIVKDIYASLL